VVRQPDHLAFAEHPFGGVAGGFARPFIDDAKRLGQGRAFGLGLAPPGQRLRRGVQERDPAGGVGGDDCVADAAEGDV
jgi:hypothetical protein